MNDRLEQDIILERTRLLYENGKASNFIVIMVAFLTGIMMHGHVSNPVIITWQVALITSACIRLALITW